MMATATDGEGLTYCPVYGGKVMPDEDENCSLCGHSSMHGQNSSALVTFDTETRLVHVQFANNDFVGDVDTAIEAFTKFATLVTNRDTIQATHDLIWKLKLMRKALGN